MCENAKCDDKLRKFKSWLLDNNCTFSDVDFQHRENSRTVTANTDIKPKSKLCHIPSNLILSILTASPFSKDLLEPIATDRWNPRLELALILLGEQANLNSKFHPYISILPSLEEVQFSNPLCWSSQVIDLLLMGSNLYYAVPERLEKMRKEWDYIQKKCIPETLRDIITWEKYVWANFMVTSRAFPLKVSSKSAQIKEGSMMLLPGIDMLDHRRGQAVEWLFEADSSGATIYTGALLHEGDIVFNNYGPKSNEELLVGYGFCLESNPEDHVLIKANLGIDELTENKRMLLKRALPEFELDSPLFLHKNKVDERLWTLLRISAMNRGEIWWILEAQSRGENIDLSNPITLRNEISMLSIFSFLLNSKLRKLKQYDPSVNVLKEILEKESGFPNLMVQFVREYRKGDFLYAIRTIRTLLTVWLGQKEVLETVIELVENLKRKILDQIHQNTFSSSKCYCRIYNLNKDSFTEGSAVKSVKLQGIINEEVMTTDPLFEEVLPKLNDLDVEAKLLLYIHYKSVSSNGSLPLEHLFHLLASLEFPSRLLENEVYQEYIEYFTDLYQDVSGQLGKMFPMHFHPEVFTLQRWLQLCKLFELNSYYEGTSSAKPMVLIAL